MPNIVIVEWIHVSDLPAEDLITANFKSEAVQAANAKLETADALIVSSQVEATPVLHGHDLQELD